MVTKFDRIHCGGTVLHCTNDGSNFRWLHLSKKIGTCLKKCHHRLLVSVYFTRSNSQSLEIDAIQLSHESSVVIINDNSIYIRHI